MEETSNFVFPRNLYYEGSANRGIQTKTPELANTLAGDVSMINAEKKKTLEDSETRKIDKKEVDFCDNDGALHAVYWNDCIAQICQDIQAKQRSAQICDFSFMKPSIIQYLFTICIRLRLPNDVRFTAALIFDIYMIRQLLSLHQFLEEQEDLNSAQKANEWENIEANVERQIPLRLLSAVQISSKAHSYHDSLSSRQIVNCLRWLSFPYPIDAVRKSELRVFKMIDFKIPESPLTACETAMKVFVYTMKKRGWIENEQYDVIWQHALVVLDVCFIYHSLVYDKFMSRQPFIDPKINKEENLVLARFKWDFMLLASAVIQAAVVCVVGREDIQVVSTVLSRLLKCNLENSILLHQAILEMVEEHQS